MFCSGVDIVGPSHVSTLFQSIPSYWAPMKKQLVHRVGDVENDQELNERISPYYHADKIKVPLLIGQGANDPRVKQAEADQIYNAMKVCMLVDHINPLSMVRRGCCGYCGFEHINTQVRCLLLQRWFRGFARPQRFTTMAPLVHLCHNIWQALCCYFLSLCHICQARVMSLSKA